MALRSKLILSGAVAGLVLATGCSPLENANNGKGYAGKADTHAFETGGGEFTAGGFKAGDKEGWADNLNVRAKAQNEYVRTGDSAKAQ
ncbi:hypothetical protein EV673_0890 [Limnobacter thiooxidans]|uniref:Lipoprotein n=1 Tax=Limnobacter thiooxidans TaxID=131080 RepID=A0AA86IYR5_9BURK|nr:hypothetical protein EV673_0890 [Limnobacter thiooxidans]BET26012.1 hypothetical protein RGQ30_15130 [Limnobacter thiooxidans]